ncbi:hypothetical protein [Cytobacillus sp. NCCP-133]|uniref:hypothetical protein n=1 Tax=Cytobacillus sp. NCCP-133 TaxID=766848 RepID=UPI00222FD35F|nr:hypothetical protein [Cytobacillus sp. NCCP-133]GLB60554.1 hypothetical protein NCCP133_26860 [Cytobacillus sp. NCCP-133]
MNNSDVNQSKNVEKSIEADGGLLESMMEPMDQLSKVAHENTQRKTNRDEER